jgi:CheY-like chemotaxis protein
MTIPLVLIGAPETATSEQPCADNLRLSGIRVLIVDDDEEGGDAVFRMLARCGAMSDRVASVKDAVDAVSRSKPNVVIAGLNVEGEWTRAGDVSGGFALPTISLSTEVSNEMRQRSRDGGFTYHLTTPIGPDLARFVALAVSVFPWLPR